MDMVTSPCVMVGGWMDEQIDQASEDRQSQFPHPNVTFMISIMNPNFLFPF